MSEGQSSQGQEKSHEATPQRIEQARKQGDVAQSKDLNAAASYIGFYVALLVIGASGTSALAFALKGFFDHPQDIANHAFDATKSADFMLGLTFESIWGVLPFFILPMAGTLAALIVQRSVVFAPSKITPKFSRLNPVDNAKKKYGMDGLVEFAKSAAKLLFICVIFGVFFFQEFSKLSMESRFDVKALPAVLLKEGILFIGIIVLFSLVMAAIDYPWSRFQHAKKLRMTHEELKKDNKETEGDPEIKRNRRERAQAIARNAMMAEVPKADVVIVNPTHYAVALQWERNGGRAPVCVAKGLDEVAQRIKAIAAESGVPIKSDPPTARALYAAVEIGDEIEREHFAAVAAAIHFSDVIRAKAKGKVT